MLKCSNMVNSVHSHDLGTIGALEATFLENRFSILARMARVTRTHPLRFRVQSQLGFAKCKLGPDGKCKYD